MIILLRVKVFQARRHSEEIFASHQAFIPNIDKKLRWVRFFCKSVGVEVPFPRFVKLIGSIFEISSINQTLTRLCMVRFFVATAVDALALHAIHVAFLALCAIFPVRHWHCVHFSFSPVNLLTHFRGLVMIYQNRIYQNRGYWIASERCHSYCSHQIQRVHFSFLSLQYLHLQQMD